MATVIASNHVVEAMYRTTEMGEGALGTRNFNKRLLGINYIVKGERFYIMLNNNAAIIGGDNQVENGIIHLVDKVIDPSLKNIPELIQTTGFFKIFTSAMNLTGFADSLRKHLDESYDYTQHTIFHDIRLPQYVLYSTDMAYTISTTLYHLPKNGTALRRKETIRTRRTRFTNLLPITLWSANCHTTR